MSELNLTDQTFHEQIQSAQLPVLVDFWAEWCAPCRMVAPVLDQIAKEYDGKIILAKCNVDENPSLAAEFDIQSIPSLMVFHKGQKIAENMGVMPKQKIVQMFSSVI